MIKRFALAAAAAVLAMSFAATPAFAHAQGTMCTDKVEVGWGTEPAYSGFQNSVQLLLTDAKTHKPDITVRAGQIKVEVSTGVEKKTLPLAPNFGDAGIPGDYRAFFVPTTPGTWTFTFSGKIGGCTIKNATFVSGPKTFDDLDNATEVQFPAKDPPSGEISKKLDNESNRLTAATSAVRSSANTAKTLGYVGIGLGAVALIVALAGLRKRA